MGKKSQAKQIRREQKNQPHHRPGLSRAAYWLIGLAVFLLLLIIAGAGYFQANKLKLMRLALQGSVLQEENDLDRYQGQFTLAESNHLRAILAEIQQLAAHPQLSLSAMGQLNFLIKVSSEIVKNGKLEPGELEKIDVLLVQVKALLGRHSRNQP